MIDAFENRLHKIFVEPEEAHPIAYSENSSVSEVRFKHDVLSLASALSHGESGVLYTESAYGFLVGLAAAYRSGCKIIVAGDLKNASLEYLSSYVSFILTDKDRSALNGFSVVPIFSTSREIDEREFCEGFELSLCTSGSTGAFSLVPKKLEQLESEVAVHETLWPEVSPGAIFCGSVSHQHVYGLLFRVLWPFLSRRTMYVPQLCFPEDFCKCFKRFEGLVFVSSPALLKRLPGLLDLEFLKDKCSLILSSGGPLDEQVARLFATQVLPITELYGSTETGGIAYRVRSTSDVLWTQLPGVRVRSANEDQCIEVCSPFLGSANWYHGHDVIEVHSEASFELKGRADRIVKLEEKRISLCQIENCLHRSELIEESVVLMHELSGSRSLLGAAVALNTAGLELIRKEGKKSLTNHLKQELLLELPKIAVPRVWKYLGALPRNAQGKILHDEIQDFFDDRQDLPFIQSVLQENNQLIAECEVPRDLCYLEGHFPERPIVPGFIQFDWAMYFAREYLVLPPQIESCKAIKFNDLLEPGQKFSLWLQYDSEKQRIQFECRCPDRKFSSGKVGF
ncbi:MAG: acyl-CoA synthetase [Bdellovibrionales bacterium]|nr:acyl-CoA synthetase [Bdellovibrionales bacterium]